MKRHCFIPVPDNNKNHRVAKVYENINGFFPLGKKNPNDPHELDKFVGRYDQVKAICDMWNEYLNLDDKQIDEIVFKSMEIN